MSLKVSSAKRRPFCVGLNELTPFLVCASDNSPPTQVKISKFGPKMYLSNVKILGNLGLIDIDL